LIYERRAFLVDSAGEMLLVKLLESELQVFKVDVENGVLEQLKSIGYRAIFLGRRCCLSVEAYDLPSIECNCIYYNNGVSLEGGIYLHRLNDGSHMQLSESFSRDVDTHCPKSLATVLMEYACYDIKP
jgi:hypothetical protein